MPQYADINAEFFVRGAARQVAQILDNYRTAVKQTNADPMIPAGGKLFKAGAALDLWVTQASWLKRPGLCQL
jgi:hypothetical protein